MFKYKYVFGPVLSRRLKLSLGLDIVPLKTCSFDCIYCECGRTTVLTTRRKEYIPVSEVLKEIDVYLSASPEVDFITFSGSGEPTLHLKIAEIIDFIKKKYPSYRLALLTNGSLLGEDKMAEELSGIDVVLPSLDAGTQKMFKIINRPLQGMNLKSIIEGLYYFRNHYSGQIWLEVFIIPGLNDTEEELAGIKRALNYIKPDKIQLNTLDRPGIDASIAAASKNQLKKIFHILDYPGEIIAGGGNYSNKSKIEGEDVKYVILQAISRRPSTMDDLCCSLGLTKEVVEKYLKELYEKKYVEIKKSTRGDFFTCIRDIKFVF